MNTPSTLAVSVPLALLLALGAAAGQPATEKIPPDEVVHPLLKGVSNPQVIPGKDTQPVYPKKWRKLHLGGRVILQGVIKKSGSVGDLTLLRTDLWVEPECGGESGAGEANQGGSAPATDPSGSTGKITRAPAAPLQARPDFEAAAVKAVKQWKYRPGEMNGAPVDVIYTILVKFTSCQKDQADDTARPH